MFNRHSPEFCLEFTSLHRKAFPGVPIAPVLGVIINDVSVEIAPNFRTLLKKPSTISSSLELNNRLIAASMAVPIGVMDPRRQVEADTAYVYLTMVEEEYRHKGLVGIVKGGLEKQLRGQAYKYMESEILMEDGYADKAVKHYGAAIVGEPVVSDPYGYGDQLTVRVDLLKAPR